MGIYLNPGKQSYQMAVNSEIFVDKTEMIRYLNSVVNTQQRYVSVSRPRRFGKTMPERKPIPKMSGTGTSANLMSSES